ncbi:hypothetical protein BaRGS_00021703 [Batillaria attramentaria]|uniref:Uncharacterized protein n=1 Tax=Batillaria attramentaria TaxID=370345 RepID=A0ABD0KIV0_9CAEN
MAEGNVDPTLAPVVSDAGTEGGASVADLTDNTTGGTDTGGSMYDEGPLPGASYTAIAVYMVICLSCDKILIPSGNDMPAQ